MQKDLKISQFRKTIRNYYQKYGRHTLPWRQTTDPYAILVSEVMLQQTQVDRVIPKYEAWLRRFPDTAALAHTSHKDVLTLWKGLGYNNRALRLKRTAEIIEKEHGGTFPKDFKKLVALPGIGPATAGDMLAFAWNIPVPVIETNIRTVYIHHFFPKTTRTISDKEILHLVEQTLDTKNPREWYWALMDYGAHLKRQGLDKNSQSKHYKKQSTFKGSNRELRSQLLSFILAEGPVTTKQVQERFPDKKEQVTKNLETMIKEGVFTKTGTVYSV